MQDVNQPVGHANCQFLRVTTGTPSSLAQPKDMGQSITATAARYERSLMEKFPPLSNSTHSRVGLMWTRLFGLP